MSFTIPGPRPNDRYFLDSDPDHDSRQCSRCGFPIPEEDVPVLMFSQSPPVKRWQYHPECLGFE